MSSSRRPLRRTFTFVVSISLVIGALVSPALGAQADVHIGGGITPDVSARAATPVQVKPGAVASFFLWVRNHDSAKLPTFFMGAATSATPVGAYWSNSATGGPYTDCPITNGRIVCTFGELTSGEDLFVVAAVKADALSSANCLEAAPAGSPGFGPGDTTSYTCVDFRFSSNQGNVMSDKPKKSRGDDYHWYDFVATDGGDDRAGQYPFCNKALPNDPCNTSLLTVFNTASASRQNVQATKVVAPEAAFNSNYASTGIAVADNFAFSCPPGIVKEHSGDADCSSHQGTTGSNKFEGQWSDVSVNSEQTFGSAFVHITITMNGVNPNSIDGLVHIWQIGETWFQRDVTTRCPTAAGPTDTNECFWAAGSGQNTIVDVWALNNGKWGNF
jgi:hypothetical protein